MKYYSWYEFDEESEWLEVMSEEEILEYYLDYWTEAMEKAGKEIVSKQNCLEDFLTVTWAREISYDEYKSAGRDLRRA